MEIDNTLYKRAVENASPLGLLVINYSLLLRHIHQAKTHCENGGGEPFLAHIDKAREYLNLLMTTLDLEYDVSKGMMKLYIYANKLLITARLQGRCEPACEACDILSSLLDSFRLIAKSGIEKEILDTVPELSARYTDTR